MSAAKQRGRWQGGPTAASGIVIGPLKTSQALTMNTLTSNNRIAILKTAYLA